MQPGNIAIIGGTGFEQLPSEVFAEPVEVGTRFGPIRLLSLAYNYVEPYRLYFLPRHGSDHAIPPHLIDYRGNTAALLDLDVKYVFATNAVGSLRRDIQPDTLVLLTDFIDFTRARPLTYFDEGEAWRHTGFSAPYSPRLRATLVTAAGRMGLKLLDRATYLCCEGPRFETHAEVRMFARWGADVVGMTGVPEVVFAREAGLEYAAVALVTNYAAGLMPGADSGHADVTERMAQAHPMLCELLLAAAGVVIEDSTRG